MENDNQQDPIISDPEQPAPDIIDDPKPTKTRKSFNIRPNPKQASYAKKFAVKEPQTKPKHEGTFKDDLEQKIALLKFIDINQGPSSVIIDVQPDYRNILLTLSYYVDNIYNELEPRRLTKLTPASLMAYFLAIIYGHALKSELTRTRPTLSQHADEFIAVERRCDLSAAINDTVVPRFLQPLIESLMPTTDSRRPGIRFVHTLACFIFSESLCSLKLTL